jgi:hypothetical protein
MVNAKGRAAGTIGEVVVPLPTDRELSSRTAEILASHPPINVLRMFALGNNSGTPATARRAALSHLPSSPDSRRSAFAGMR